MSEQYQRFKQNFFRQHPPSSNQSTKPTQQTTNKSFKQYDPYAQYTSHRNNTYESNGGQQLRIQNQTHFPFQQIEQTTFQELDNDPFLSYRQQSSSNDQNISKSGQNKGYAVSNSKQMTGNQQQYEQHQYRSYGLDHSGRDLPIRTESQLEYRTVSKHEYPPLNYTRLQHSTGIDTINHQLDGLRLTRQEHAQMNHNGMVEIQHRNNQTSNVSHYDVVNKQYIEHNSRTNHLIPVSPQKQLPVIYNRPSSHSNSQHKIHHQQNFNQNNSRVIIQQTPQQTQKPNVHLTPPPNNQMHPLIITQPQTFNQIPHTFNQVAQIPQPINSGSRVIIQSEMVNQSKGLIQSNHNIPPPAHSVAPPGYNIVHQPVMVNPPPSQVHFESRNAQQGIISMKEYQRLKSECSMWQQKYYQTNDLLTRLQAQRELNPYGNGFSQQTVILRQENTRLMEKIRTLENADKNSSEKIKSSYQELMKKYQSSLTKQTNLLIDRFRLEMKHNQRY